MATRKTPVSVQQKIIDALADGQSLRAICREKGMPSLSTVMRWLEDDAEWRDQYARARAIGIDAMAEDIQAIADRDDIDPNSRRVMIDTRKWLMARRAPKKYGDKVGLEVSGPDNGPIEIRRVIVE